MKYKVDTRYDGYSSTYVVQKRRVFMYVTIFWTDVESFWTYKQAHDHIKTL